MYKPWAQIYIYIYIHVYILLYSHYLSYAYDVDYDVGDGNDDADEMVMCTNAYTTPGVTGEFALINSATNFQSPCCYAWGDVGLS